VHMTWVFALLFFLLGRGGIELVLPKKLAIFLQFTALLSLSSLLFFKEARRFTEKEKPLLFFAAAFMLSLLLSAGLTFILKDTLEWIPLLLFFSGLLGLFLLMTRNFTEKELNLPFEKALLFFGCFLFAVALGEQLTLYAFEGTGAMVVIRPASLTGSFLHYPLVMTLIGFLLLQFSLNEKRKGLLFLSLLFIISPFFYASRSGMVITLSSFAIYPFLIQPRRAMQACALAFLLLFTVSSIAYGTYHAFPKSKAHFLIERVITASQSKAVGNQIRIRTWKRVAKEWLASNWILGEETGKITNASTHTTGQARAKRGLYNVAESSPLQLLSNFGLLGLISFYGLLLQIPRYIPKSQPWILAAFGGALLQTLIYQSIEVLSFMGLLFLFPFFAQQQAFFKKPHFVY